MKHTHFRAAPSRVAAAEIDPDAPPSKSQRKRDMQDLQDLGEKLSEMSRARIDVLDVSDTLRQALRDMAGIHSHEGRRRHAQYIGRLMRGVDPAPLRQALLDASGDSRAAVARMHHLEDLRTALLADDAALTDLVKAHPGADVQELRQMVRAARTEQAAGRPPRNYRALYQRLKELLEAADAAAEGAHPATGTEVVHDD